MDTPASFLLFGELLAYGDFHLAAAYVNTRVCLHFQPYLFLGVLANAGPSRSSH